MRGLFTLLACSLSILSAISIDIPEKYRESHIPVSRCPSHRPSHYPVITGDTFRAFCDHIIDETTQTFIIDNVRERDTIFVGMPYIDFFLNEVLPQLSVPIILVSSNGSGTIGESYRKYLDDPNIIAWFSRNLTVNHPKGIIIPLGVKWFSEDGNLDKAIELYKDCLATIQLESFFTQKKHVAYCNFADGTHKSRPVIYKYFLKQPYCFVGERKDLKNYLNDLKNSKFIISPRGYNIDCYRTRKLFFVDQFL